MNKADNSWMNKADNSCKSDRTGKADRIWIKSMKICRRYCGCHQMPERSFFIGSYQFPLCARCTGILIGHLLGIGISFLHLVPPVWIIGTIPLMIDGTVQKLTRYESTNLRRLWTGILYGFSFMSVLIGVCVRLIGTMRK